MNTTQTPETTEETLDDVTFMQAFVPYMITIAVPWPTRSLWRNRKAFIGHFVR
jgi:hypothetical protein